MQFNPNAEILVLDEDGTNLGRMPYRDAKSLSVTRSLDLVLVNKNEKTQVFKIMDHGKWKYEQKKNKSKQKKTTHHLKEMNFKMRIDTHDMDIKINRIKSFLEKGDDVKICVTMRGRERANPRMAHDKMDAILAQLGDSVVQQRRSTNSQVFVSVRPVIGKNNAKPSTTDDKNTHAESGCQSAASGGDIQHSSAGTDSSTSRSNFDAA